MTLRAMPHISNIHCIIVCPPRNSVNCAKQFDIFGASAMFRNAVQQIAIYVAVQTEAASFSINQEKIENHVDTR